MKLLERRIDELLADPANARVHPDENIEGIKASLLQFGQQKPIVMDTAGVVRAGNGVLMAAKALGWETLYAVESELDQVAIVAYAIADNRLGETSHWDDAAVARQLAALKEERPELLNATGWSDAEIKTLIEGAMMPMDTGGELGGIIDDESLLNEHGNLIAMVFLFEEAAQSETIKTELREFCERHELQYKFKPM